MLFDMPTCGGCRTCELACSFHHRNEFIPAISSIRIVDKHDERGFKVELTDAVDACRQKCDGCRELDVPMCLQYCSKKEELTRILDEFTRAMPQQEPKNARTTG